MDIEQAKKILFGNNPDDNQVIDDVFQKLWDDAYAEGKNESCSECEQMGEAQGYDQGYGRGYEAGHRDRKNGVDARA